MNNNKELDGAKAYNDYASYLNLNENTNYILNEISDYIPNPRNIPDDNKNLVLEKKSSKYIGVSYDNTRQHFVTSMRFKKSILIWVITLMKLNVLKCIINKLCILIIIMIRIIL